jgi:hypothetical protein
MSITDSVLRVPTPYGWVSQHNRTGWISAAGRDCCPLSKPVSTAERVMRSNPSRTFPQIKSTRREWNILSAPARSKSIYLSLSSLTFIYISFYVSCDTCCYTYTKSTFHLFIPPVSINVYHPNNFTQHVQAILFASCFFLATTDANKISLTHTFMSRHGAKPGHRHFLLLLRIWVNTTNCISVYCRNVLSIWRCKTLPILSNHRLKTRCRSKERLKY